MNRQLSTTPIIQIRNSRTAVKRAKLEFKQSTLSKAHTVERTGMIHEVLGYKTPRMNCKLSIL